MGTRLCFALGRTVAAVLLLTALAAPEAAADRLVKIDTRPGVTVAFWYMPRPGATATVVLLPGGSGSIGMKHGKPTSRNFLVRSRDLFAGHDVSVAIVGRPSDKKDLDNDFRADPRHVADLRAVVAYLKKDSGLPVWLIGTSRGTISAAAAAIAFGADELAGVVLTSSITSYRIAAAVPRQPLDRIRIPVLVMHHEKDACPVCAPYEVKYILRGLTHAPVKKLVMVNGGGDPRGDPCEALHWHGYIGMEPQAVDTIMAWIKNPTP
jgi:pimeloyl-ACP methyl ester carboxylesterase